MAEMGEEKHETTIIKEHQMTNLLPNHMVASFRQYQAKWALGGDSLFVPCLAF